MKPANLLLDESGCLKIADFGLARVFQNTGNWKKGDSNNFDKKSPGGLVQSQQNAIPGDFSHQVATRWYRAPELLFGARNYDESVDIWAVGCIFGEMLNHGAIFPGQNDIDQLICIQNLLGTPSTSIWPEMTDLPDFHKINFDTVPVCSSKMTH